MISGTNCGPAILAYLLTTVQPVDVNSILKRFHAHCRYGDQIEFGIQSNNKIKCLVFRFGFHYKGVGLIQS